MSTKTLEERREEGKEAAVAVPPAAHAEWFAPQGRPAPVLLLVGQNELRVPWLVPVRHARTAVSPFTFYRGTARIMATDLATLPHTGLDVQLVGDAHLANFGAYASPERKLVFDSNDFDETLRGPWDWDLKRLAVSFTIAARDRGFDKAVQRSVTARVVEAYRLVMADSAAMGFLELWYEHIAVDEVSKLGGAGVEKTERRIEKFTRKAKKKNSLQALSKPAVEVEDRFQIRSEAPVLVPLRELLPEYEPEEIEQSILEAFADYKETLRDDRQALLDRYQLVDYALKVVGVGSVGTRCVLLLLEGRDRRDPLFLQAKEATRSVLEEHLPASPYKQHGQRVVQGQRQIQAQSDICLGWTTGVLGKHYYIRQLRDWKRSVDLESIDVDALEFYATLCGHTRAPGHARSGDPVAIAAYMGESDGFDRALVEFSEKYADQAEADYEAFQAAIADGTLSAADEY